VSGLNPEQYGLVRSFLLRLPSLAPEARAVVAVRLANPVALRLSHTPPPMLNPEMFLLAVASAYQLRHGMTTLQPMYPYPQGPGWGQPAPTTYQPWSPPAPPPGTGHLPPVPWGSPSQPPQ
jgi:hypothetical protein